MKIAAEIHVNSTACFADGDARHEVNDPLGRFVATISNNPTAGPFAQRALRVEMVFEAISLDTASAEALENLVPLLNALAFTTSASYSDPVVVRAIDWTPGLIEREARYYSTPQASVTTPMLQAELIETATRMMALLPDEVSLSAMRWYRLGLGATAVEEQFSYFWFAVEITAEALKAAGKIAPRCPKCDADLYCPTCESVPTRRRVGSEAIADLISSVAPEGADIKELVNTLSKIRNTLQHGRRMASIADRLPCTEEQAVNILARIAWRGIMKLADPASVPTEGHAVTIVQTNDVVNRTMTAGAQVFIGMTGGDPENPDLMFAPDIQVSLTIEDKEFTFDGRPIAG